MGSYQLELWLCHSELNCTTIWAFGAAGTGSNSLANSSQLVCTCPSHRKRVARLRHRHILTLGTHALVMLSKVRDFLLNNIKSKFSHRIHFRYGCW